MLDRVMIVSLASEAAEQPCVPSGTSLLGVVNIEAHTGRPLGAAV